MSSDTQGLENASLVPARSSRRRLRLAAFVGPVSATAAALTLVGCGLAGTAASTATGAAAEAQQAKQAKATEDRVQQQVEAAMQTDAQKRADAEKAAQ